jgi:hypothetical protein
MKKRRPYVTSISIPEVPCAKSRQERQEHNGIRYCSESRILPAGDDQVLGSRGPNDRRYPPPIPFQQENDRRCYKGHCYNQPEDAIDAGNTLSQLIEPDHVKSLEKAEEMDHPMQENQGCECCLHDSK